jgi:hypothetical protein
VFRKVVRGGWEIGRIVNLRLSGDRTAVSIETVLSFQQVCHSERSGKFVIPNEERNLLLAGTKAVRRMAQPYPLLQLRVFRLRLFQNGDAGVGILPKHEEIFVGRERPHAGGIGIRALPLSLKSLRLQSVRARNTKPS